MFKSVETIKKLLDELSGEEILEVVEEAIRIFRHKQKSPTSSSTRPSIESSQISKLIRENWENCVITWKKSKGDLDRLRSIANNLRPTITELKLLEEALPLEWEALEEIYSNEFTFF